jgi:hypothetical protein
MGWWAAVAILAQMATKRGRPQSSAHTDVDDAAAAAFFDAHLQTAKGPTGAFPYSKGKSTDGKKAIVWAEANRILFPRASPHPPTHQQIEKVTQMWKNRKHGNG